MSPPRIVVVGLGYVGLPLAVALARKFEVIGLDRDERRIDELRRGLDRTDEVDEASLRASSLTLGELGHDVDVADPIADAAQLRDEFGLELSTPKDEKYDLVVGAVAHADYRIFSDGDLEGMLRPGGTLADVRGMWRDRALDPSIDRWSL